MLEAYRERQLNRERKTELEKSGKGRRKELAAGRQIKSRDRGRGK